uniref:Uncharacterized protein n=1 Tax=Tanacetum cinerariifolium TaxID=118510 RepID=A0A699HVE3_TANCI|nr:hypothetical protein [Tanacetum cinerariifolium]
MSVGDEPVISECLQEHRSLSSLAIGNVAATKAHVDKNKYVVVGVKTEAVDQRLTTEDGETRFVRTEGLRFLVFKQYWFRRDYRELSKISE